jgi:hypothetical protein
MEELLSAALCGCPACSSCAVAPAACSTGAAQHTESALLQGRCYWYGLRHFASNYTTLQLAPALGSYALATLLAGWLYDREAQRQGNSSPCGGGGSGGGGDHAPASAPRAGHEARGARGRCGRDAVVTAAALQQRRPAARSSCASCAGCASGAGAAPTCMSTMTGM